MSLLNTKIKKLQDDYKEILKNAVKNLSTQDYPFIIDEINIFWYSNRDLVQLFLSNISPDFNCYVFTAATFLDVEDFEHYPFIALGDFHILDDPLCKYSRSAEFVPDSPFSQHMKEQILITAKDNLKILENCSDLICIMPVRFLTDIDSDLSKDASNQVFLSMFKEKDLTIEKYFKSYHSIEEVIEGLGKGVIDSLVFSNDDDRSQDLASRFYKFKSENIMPFGDNKNDAMVFYLVMFSFFLQAFEIIFMCAEYQVIPYIRYDVAFQYLLTLSTNFINKLNLQEIVFKSMVAHVLYKSFDKTKVQSIDFKKYADQLKIDDFNNNVFNDINQKGMTLKKASVLEISKIIDNRFEELFNHLNDGCQIE